MLKGVTVGLEVSWKVYMLNEIDRGEEFKKIRYQEIRWVVDNDVEISCDF